jgi:hypothetical protein
MASQIKIGKDFLWVLLKLGTSDHHASFENIMIKVVSKYHVFGELEGIFSFFFEERLIFFDSR